MCWKRDRSPSDVNPPIEIMATDPVEPASGPPFDTELAQRMKRAVRRRMAAVRQALPAAARDLRSAHIVELVSSSPAFAASHGVGLYAAMVERGEVDVSRLDALARKAGKRVYYPFMDKTASGHTTGFRQVRDSRL